MSMSETERTDYDWPTAWEWKQMSSVVRYQFAEACLRQSFEQRDPTFPEGRLTLAQEIALGMMREVLLQGRWDA